MAEPLLSAPVSGFSAPVIDRLLAGPAAVALLRQPSPRWPARADARTAGCRNRCGRPTVCNRCYRLAARSRRARDRSLRAIDTCNRTPVAPGCCRGAAASETSGWRPAGKPPVSGPAPTRPDSRRRPSRSATPPTATAAVAAGERRPAGTRRRSAAQELLSPGQPLMPSRSVPPDAEAPRAAMADPRFRHSSVVYRGCCEDPVKSARWVTVR